MNLSSLRVIFNETNHQFLKVTKVNTVMIIVSAWLRVRTHNLSRRVIKNHRKIRPLVKFNLRQITKHFAKVSFWTTWLEVSRRVRVCKILTSSMPDSISIHSVSVTYLAPLNRYRLEIGFKTWCLITKLFRIFPDQIFNIKLD